APKSPGSSCANQRDQNAPRDSPTTPSLFPRTAGWLLRPLTLPTTSRRALSSSSFASSFFASSLVDAVAPRYRSGAKATNPALASRSERPLKKSVKPHHAWRTRTPGPLPFFGTDKNPGTLPSGLLSSIIPMFSDRLGGRLARI